MKKIFLTNVISIITLSACASNGGHTTIDANKISTQSSTTVLTFSEKGYKFEYLGIKNDGDGNFVFASNNSYIQSINGKPDHLMRFKTPNTSCDFIVYGLNGSNDPIMIKRENVPSENQESTYVISGYDNFRIEYYLRPGETSFEVANIGTLYFWC